MSYKLNKTNGELLVDLVDGQIDTTSTDLTLVGRNYKGFGEFINENFIKLIENFAKTSAPRSPLIGQLWYDTAEQRLKIYTGETFRSASGAVVSQTQPNLVTGDLWIDSLNNKLYFFDGTDIQLVGPQYTASQGKTSVEAMTIIDENGQDQTVLFMYISGLLTGIFSRAQFRPRENITSFPVDPDDNRVPKRQILRPGFNPVDTAFWWRGTATASRGLISDSNEEFTEANFMKTDRDTQTTGSLQILEPTGRGLTIGVQSNPYLQIKIVNEVTTLENTKSEKDFVIRTRRGNTYDPAIKINAVNQNLGIFRENPTYTLDVNGTGFFQGDLTVNGNFRVEGDTTYFNVATLRVEDKNIELGYLSDSTQGVDLDVDGSGIIIKSEDGDKTFLWDLATDSWTSNVNLNLELNQEYMIDGTTVLSQDRLHDGILYATGLVRIGTLQELDVDDISINGSTITSSTPLFISSSNTITINNRRVTGVASPIDPDDVATKEYVDAQIDAEPVVFALDVTGFSNPSTSFATDGPWQDVQDVLEYMYPAGQKVHNTEARIFASSFISAQVSNIDVEGALTKSYVSVYVDPQDSTTPQLESVLQDVAFSPVNANATLTPTRGKMDFRVNNGVWEWVRTTPV